MFKGFDLQELRSNGEAAFYFRYPLEAKDFHEFREEERLLGRFAAKPVLARFAAKPLYGCLTPEGRVDRSAGLNGQVAILYLPARAKSPRSAKVLLTRVPRGLVTLPNGRRNWPAIWAAAERAVRRELAREGSRPAARKHRSANVE